MNAAPDALARSLLDPGPRDFREIVSWLDTVAETLQWWAHGESVDPAQIVESADAINIVADSLWRLKLEAGLD